MILVDTLDEHHHMGTLKVKYRLIDYIVNILQMLGVALAFKINTFEHSQVHEKIGA